ncbi:MAG: hypothetical protein HY720_10015 [Planctomycetes bacterium]|nr:hypothetical protein [Planctomycetota bacterium]
MAKGACPDPISDLIVQSHAEELRTKLAELPGYEDEDAAWWGDRLDRCLTMSELHALIRGWDVPDLIEDAVGHLRACESCRSEFEAQAALMVSLCDRRLPASAGLTTPAAGTDPTRCPGVMDLRAFALGELSSKDRGFVGQHVDGCDSCAGKVAALA